MSTGALPSRQRRAATARRWQLGFAAALLACLLALVTNLALSELRPGNAFGIAYGVLAALLMLAAAGFGLRRRAMRLVTRLGFGTARSWLWLHLYGGLLFGVLVLLHVGFRLPEGGLGWMLWGLAIWTVATGLVGLGLQQWIPKALGSGLGVEVHYARIPELVGELRERAEATASGASWPVRQLHARKVLPELALVRPGWRYFVDPTGSIQARLGEFEYLRGVLSGEDRERVEELEGIYRTKLEMDAHATLQRALRDWLLLHVPTSLVLVVAVVVHVGLVLWY